MKKNIIFYSKQSINQSDIRSVTKILKSNFLTSGPTIEKFESRVLLLLNVNILCHQIVPRPLCI